MTNNSGPVWVVTATSESGDQYGPEIFDHPPTDNELSYWCHSCDGHFNEPELMATFDPGPGFDGSFVYPVVTKTKPSLL